MGTEGLTAVAAQVERDGYAVVDGVLPAAEVAELVARAEASMADGAGDRNALAWPWVAALAADPLISGLASACLGGPVRAVRGILFDKVPGANWKLGFHQDRALALAERREVDGFVGWSVKDGVVHALAPADVLERMVAVRLSLDDCGSDNGPLRVVPGSHRHGLLPKGTAVSGEVACTLAAGGVVMMKPLTLHASSAAVSPRHRRVVHIEYIAGDLPGGLRFHTW